MKMILLPTLLFFFFICKTELKECFQIIPTKKEECFSAKLEFNDEDKARCCFLEMKCSDKDCPYNGKFCDEFPNEMTTQEELVDNVKEIYSGWNVYDIKVVCEDNYFILKIGLLFVLGLLF